MPKLSASLKKNRQPVANARKPYRFAFAQGCFTLFSNPPECPMSNTTPQPEIPRAKAARFTLYGSRFSPYVRKIRVLCAEKSIEYELIDVNVFDQPPWFAQISPLKRIPVLHDAEAPGDGFLPDSSIIAAYLDRLVPTPALYPAAPWSLARATWLEEYVDTDLIGRLGPGLFFPRVVSRLMGKECDEALAQKSLTLALPPFFAYLEQQLGQHQFFISDTMTIADIAIAAPFVNFHHAGEMLTPKLYPALTEFVARMLARPSFANVIVQEEGTLRKLGFRK
jgi:glutathione S-transferase